MTSIPIAIFFIPFALFLVVYFFFLFFNIYHIRVYGVHGFLSHAIVTIFSLGTLLILGGTWIVIAQYDWSTTLDVQGLSQPFINAEVIHPF